MGTALVIPTKEVKMLMPNTAANLQRALRKPNAVVLKKSTSEESMKRIFFKRNETSRTENMSNMAILLPHVCTFIVSFEIQ